MNDMGRAGPNPSHGIYIHLPTSQPTEQQVQPVKTPETGTMQGTQGERKVDTPVPAEIMPTAEKTDDKGNTVLTKSQESVNLRSIKEMSSSELTELSKEIDIDSEDIEAAKQREAGASQQEIIQSQPGEIYSRFTPESEPIPGTAENYGVMPNPDDAPVELAPLDEGIKNQWKAPNTSRPTIVFPEEQMAASKPRSASAPQTPSPGLERAALTKPRSQSAPPDLQGKMTLQEANVLAQIKKSEQSIAQLAKKTRGLVPRFFDFMKGKIRSAANAEKSAGDGWDAVIMPSKASTTPISQATPKTPTAPTEPPPEPPASLNTPTEFTHQPIRGPQQPSDLNPATDPNAAARRSNAMAMFNEAAIQSNSTPPPSTSRPLPTPPAPKPLSSKPLPTPPPPKPLSSKPLPTPPTAPKTVQTPPPPPPPLTDRNRLDIARDMLKNHRVSEGIMALSRLLGSEDMKIRAEAKAILEHLDHYSRKDL